MVARRWLGRLERGCDVGERRQVAELVAIVVSERVAQNSQLLATISSIHWWRRGLRGRAEREREEFLARRFWATRKIHRPTKRNNKVGLGCEASNVAYILFSQVALVQ